MTNLSRQKMASKWIDVLEKGKPCRMMPYTMLQNI